MRRMVAAVIATLILALTLSTHVAAEAAAPSDSFALSGTDAERRVAELLSRMTLKEKLELLGGVDGFDVPGAPRIGLPVMHTADGPFGVRRLSRSNVMAGGIALAATWNTELSRRVGEEVGRDARARGVHFYLAPGVNLYRSSLNGRNFEYLGEDPYLASRMAVPLIQGVQAQGVAATVKHFLGNNSEFLRHVSDSVIDDRTLREIYLPAFEAAVQEARVAAVMASYNLVNGEHMSQNRRFNVDLLKGEWRFPGVLMSDWDSTYDTEGAANGGLDLEMPSGQFLNREKLLPLILAGKVSQATIDDKVRRLLRTAVRFGWLDRHQLDASIPRFNQQGVQVALQTAREGIVLLKNDGGVLPLEQGKLKTLAVIGPNAYPSAPHGGGSVTVAPFRTVSLLEGLSSRLGTNADVRWARGIPDLRVVADRTQFSTGATGGKPGVTVEVFDNGDLSGSPTSTRVDAHIQQGAPLDFTPMALGELDRSLMFPARPVSMRWTGFHTPASAGSHDIFVQFGGFARGVGHRLYVDDKLVSDYWDMKHSVVEQARLDLDARPHKVVLEYRGEVGGLTGATPFARLGITKQGDWVDPIAEQIARSADAVVLAVGFDTTTELEDWDRGFGLPPGQEELIQRIAAANRNTIVVVTSGGAVDTNAWLERVPAMLQAWYPGQEGGTALAEILFGDVNPSGKLPATFERRLADNPAQANYYPLPGTKRVQYAEGIFVGYRGYEEFGTQPLFPFGYGLSYTTFEFGDLKVETRPGSSARPKAGSDVLFDVSFTVTNTGRRAGATVPQIYVADRHARVARPPKELKGFTKVMLQPGEKRTLTVPLNTRAFTYYDVRAKKWCADAGSFGVLVGSSSAKTEVEGRATLARSVCVPA